MENIFFINWESIVRTVILTVLGYLSIIFLLRASGKRTLSKMNAFDFIITIALGSTLANLALSKQVSLADGFVAFFLFIFLQYSFTWLSVRIKRIKHLITNDPSLLFYKGAFLKDQMKKHRMTREEILKASRQKGFSSLDSVDMIILETTGDISFVKKTTDSRISTTDDVVLEK